MRLPEGCPRLQSQGPSALAEPCLRVSFQACCPPTPSSCGWHQHGQMVTSRGRLLSHIASGQNPPAKCLDRRCQARALPIGVPVTSSSGLSDQPPGRAQKRAGSSVPPSVPKSSLESAELLEPQVNPGILSLPASQRPVSSNDIPQPLPTTPHYFRGRVIPAAQPASYHRASPHHPGPPCVLSPT